DRGTHYFLGVSDLLDLAKSPKEHNILYRNNGDGTFTDVTEKAGLKGLGWGGDIAVFDYNEDGYLDVLVTNMFGRCQLYRNHRHGTHTEGTPGSLGETALGGAGCKAFGSNNDGRLDLFIVAMHSDMWVTVADSDTAIITENRKYGSFLGPLAVASIKA